MQPQNAQVLEGSKVKDTPGSLMWLCEWDIAARCRVVSLVIYLFSVAKQTRELKMLKRK